jgi:hypothetical protein
MPNSYVLNIFVFLANLGDGVFEPIGKSLSVSFKFYPSVLKLAMSSIVNRLPVIINNKISNIDIMR